MDVQNDVQRFLEQNLSEWDRILYWRFGLRNVDVLRQAAREFLLREYQAPLQECLIDGQVFNFVIAGEQHILVEIIEAAGRNTQERLEHKNQLFTDVTGIRPAKTILFPGWINSRRAQALRDAGIDVIELEPDPIEPEDAEDAP
ncbi:MAG: hypothetical protein HY741_20365 [Chloroflexi bacterium]|nr:hypothetical protein [Chloroflexota bacterium]